jgi:hypothetical protein
MVPGEEEIIMYGQRFWPVIDNRMGVYEPFLDGFPQIHSGHGEFRPPLTPVVPSPAPKIAKQWLAAKKKFDKTMASLSPGAQEAMAGVTTIMNGDAVNCTTPRR